MCASATLILRPSLRDPELMQESGSSFTGRARQRKTSPRVLLADRAARLLISVGGIGTIFAVLGVCVFLVWVVVPLFLPAAIENLDSFASDAEQIMHLEMDEYGLLAWMLRPSGQIEVFRLDNGELRQTLEVAPDAARRRLVLAERDPQPLGDSLAGQVVARRPETAGEDEDVDLRRRERLLRRRRRHHDVRVGRADAADELAQVDVGGLIEPEPRLARAGVGAVTGETVVRERPPDVASEVELLGDGGKLRGVRVQRLDASKQPIAGDEYEIDGVTRQYYAMPYGDYYIWGATAGMLVNLVDVLTAERAGR